MPAITNSFNEDPERTANRLMNDLYLRDGLPEISIGMILLIFSGLNWLPVFAPSWRLNGRGLYGIFIGLALTTALLCLTSAPIINWIRKRYLIERVGYVKRSLDKKQKKFLVWVTGASTVCSMLLAFAFFRRYPHGPGSWYLLVLGALFCVVTLFRRQIRIKIFGLLSLAAGVLLGFLNLPINKSIAIFFTFLGALSLISGIAVLLQFIRTAKQEAEA